MIFNELGMDKSVSLSGVSMLLVNVLLHSPSLINERFLHGILEYRILKKWNVSFICQIFL